jgi:branched-chain amino acid transport system permease protein
MLDKPQQTTFRPSASWSGLQSLRPLAPVIVLVGLLALVPVLAEGLDQPFLIRVFTRMVVFAIAAVSLNIVLGVAGLVSLMHAALFGLGGYTVAILAEHGTTELLVLVPAAILGSGLAAAVFGLIALRTAGAYFIMITLAFNQMFFYFFVALERYGGEEGLQVFAPLDVAGMALGGRTTIFYLCLAVLLAVLVAGTRLADSRFGMVIRAAAGNDRRVSSVGIAPLSYRLAVFVIAGAVAGLAGALLVVSQTFISPAEMSWVRSGDLIVMVVLGGMATVWGPALGAVVFLLLELVLSALTIHWQLPFGIIIILLVLFLRDGLANLIGALRSGDGGRGHD